MAGQLFIIGNGFDLHHRIQSRYSHFGAYLAQVDPTCAGLLQEYLNVDEDFWNCFEHRLASFDQDAVLDHAGQFLVSYGAEDWSDASHHDFEYEIEQVVGGISETMRRHFADWVRGLQLPAPGTVPRLRCIDPAADFISFNYTPTLQRLYGVPDGNVLHIHGSAADRHDEIVLGHGWERPDGERLSRGVDEDTDTRVAGGYRLIDGYFADTFKPTDEIIRRSGHFLSRADGVDRILVLGHSLAPVDLPYLQEVDARAAPTARWTVSYYDSPDRQVEGMEALGVPADRVTYAPLAEL